MVLACDVGNSRTKFGLFSPTLTELPDCRRSLTFDGFADVDWPAVRDCLAGYDFGSVPAVLSGTSRDGLARIADGWRRELNAKPLLIENAELSNCLAIDVDQPDGVGIDRLLNAFAVNAIRPADRPAIVVDSGTATTVDLMTATGAFAGGAILPGFELSARSLNEYTSLLPYLGIDQIAANTPAPLGRNTQAAIHSGLYWGQIGAVTRLIDALSESTDPLVVVTGGGAGILVEHLPNAVRERHLTLQGLVLAYLHSEASA